jgi:ribosomal protein S3
MGRLGVKVWIYKGDILPEAKEEEAAEAPVAQAVPAPTAPSGSEAIDVTTKAS